MLLVDYLAQEFPTAKRTTLRRMLEDRRVRINGAPALSLKQEVTESDDVQVLEKREEPTPSLNPLRCIHEDEDILVIDKPPGLLTSTLPNEKRPTAIAIIRRHLEKSDPRARAGVIHRLDKDASGLLVFSKNHAAFASLKKQLFERSVERIYSAVVEGVPQPPSGRIETKLVELTDGSVRTTRIHGKGEVAVTDYQTLKTVGRMSLVRVTLHTGRKHQIRTHLSQRGAPIVGDSVYGAKTSEAAHSRLMLAATRLCLNHPRTGRRMEFEIPIPRELRDLLKEG